MCGPAKVILVVVTTMSSMMPKHCSGPPNPWPHMPVVVVTASAPVELMMIPSTADRLNLVQPRAAIGVIAAELVSMNTYAADGRGLGQVLGIVMVAAFPYVTIIKEAPRIAPPCTAGLGEAVGGRPG